MKNFKLWVHQKTFSEDELVINPKEFPDVNIGDILEIYHPDEENSHLLLQVRSFKDDLQQSSKEIVSVEQGVASLFQLRAYKAVRVQKVQPGDVALDLVELVFKEQYISRSDMWRLKNSLVHNCIHIQQKVELSGVRAQVQELWSRGEKVRCGAITHDTRVAFRSATAMVYLFVQMSSEMWDFDTFGDLYWEKAVGGFLTDLFNKWRDKGVNNEVTVVLFSRTFFKARSRDEFPDAFRDQVKVDYEGRLFQDFYRTIAHHERRDEWHGLLQTLKAHFTTYLDEVMCHTDRTGPVPEGYNSTAAEGNFLETLNMALNVFDKHYVDRNFERTGQLVVILTPGAGVFDVDREMCKITRQRMIDYGIGSDLVCLAEQPLHAVPLFKFHNKTKESSLLGGDYNIPHWLNYSFYTKEKGLGNGEKFKPRIKLAEKKVRQAKESLPTLVNGFPPISARHALLRHISSDHSLAKSDDIDYQCEEYDEVIFKIPSCKTPRPRTPASMRPSSAARGARNPASVGHFTALKGEDQASQWRGQEEARDASGTRCSPGNVPRNQQSEEIGSPTTITIPGRVSKGNPLARLQREATALSQSFEGGQTRKPSPDNQGSVSPQRVVVGSAGAIHNTATHLGQPGQNLPRALVNPFGTSNMVMKLTSNRRRWTHTFPQGPTGATIQVHHRNQPSIAQYHHYHYHPPHHMSYRTHRISATQGSSPSSPYHPRVAGSSGARTPSDSAERPGIPHSTSDQRLRPSASGSSLFSAGSSPSNDTALQRPGSASTLDHGVDWKSLTATACLPVTTDFYPERISLESDFVEFNYELLAEEDITGPFMTVEAIFQELISQRLLQGFQLVVLPSSVLSAVIRSQRHPPLVTNPDKGEYVLSIGRIFHKLRLHSEKKTISVTMYRPRHPSLCDPIQYTYQLWSVQNEGYAQIQTTFRHEVIERYNWNYLDNYISSHDSDFTLVDSLKFWRSRFMLIPNTPVLVKRFAEETGDSPLDVSSCLEDQAFCHFQIDAFLRFIEILNGIRRQTSTSRGPRTPHSSGRQTPISGDLAHPGIRSSPMQGSEKQRHPSGVRSPQGSPAPHPPSQIEVIPDQLSLSSPLPTIAKAMADPGTGLRFLPAGQKGLPANCFVAGEASTWVQRTLSGNVSAPEAFELLKSMQENKLIQHASGYAHISFISGFYVYCLTLPENVPPMTEQTKGSHSWRDYLTRLEVNSEFPGHWFEVAVVDKLSWTQGTTETGLGGSGNLNQDGLFRQSPWSVHEMGGGRRQSSGLGLGPASFVAIGQGTFKPPDTKNVLLEIDCNKTDRVEWCHVTYDGYYRVDRAFDLQIEWLVCTPSLLNDMLQGWYRKANTFGFHLVPAPTDPFHQHPDFANPLRCPLFIPLAMEALSPSNALADAEGGLPGGDGGEEEEEEEGQRSPQPGEKCIDVFQDLILQQLGFILVSDRRKSSFAGYGFHSGSKNHQAEYIHKSGVSFVTLINSADDSTVTPNPSSTRVGQMSSCTVVKVPSALSSPSSDTAAAVPITIGRDGNFEIVDAHAERVVEVQDGKRKLRSGSIKEVRGENLGGAATSVGFLWSLNHMLTKRWRCSACGDEKVYDSLMKDLIEMSRNVNGKLTDFWLQNKDMFGT